MEQLASNKNNGRWRLDLNVNSYDPFSKMASILDFRALKSSENMTPLFLRIFIVSFNKIYM